MRNGWTKWENQVVNGYFPLRRSLGSSDHSAAFLTEHKEQMLPDAVLKLVPAIPTLKQAQMSQWSVAAGVSHPHLARLLDSGQCQLGGLPFLFVAMEYAEQTLAQILSGRALSADELASMLRPALRALSFLHRKNLVLGGLKPSNVLIVKERLKLASDTIRPAGAPNASIASVSSMYEPPESRDGSYATAGDIWCLGVTMVEALTRQQPSWHEASGTVVLPAGLPPTFAVLICRCLNLDPAKRPTVCELEAEINSVQQESRPRPRVSVPKSSRQRAEVVRQFPDRPRANTGRSSARVARVERERAIPASQSFRPRWLLPVMVVVGTLAIAAWRGPPAPAPGPQIPEPAAVVAEPSVIHEELPDVPPKALQTIHGSILLAVRVTVDRSGTVVHAAADQTRSSKYFSRLATQAATQWRFAPTDERESRKWLLRFEFTRNGVTAHRTPT